MLTKKDYRKYMRSDTWDKKRRQRLDIDGYTCQDCGATNKPLDVHHLSYKRLGKERPSDLVSLCRRCHDRRHDEGVTEVGACGTCGKVLHIIRRWLSDYWTRWICADGHIVEKRGWHE